MEIPVPLDPAIGSALEVLTRAFHSHAWAALAGALLMVFITVLRTVGALKWLPEALVPLGAVGLATLSSIALGLSTGVPWPTILVTGLVTGVSAIGTWEAAGKPVMKPLLAWLEARKTASK